jgi:LPS O-antigen subunit length determinant protein (WzzB/FepE family)
MKKKIVLITICVFISLGLLYNLLSEPIYIPKKIIDPPELTNTDTIYQQIEKLQIKSDTIKLYYETKINTYRTLPTPKRVRIFSERINRQ